MPPSPLLLLLLVVVVMVGAVAGLCPPSCTCDPGHLAVTCSNASLQVATRSLSTFIQTSNSFSISPLSLTLNSIQVQSRIDLNAPEVAAECQ